MKDILYIIIPAYNEADNVEQVIRDWYPVIEKHNGNGMSRMIVIDDGSNDSTFSVINGLTEEFPLLVGLTKKNEGHGATLWYGYQYAIDNGAEYVFQTDSDGQTLPEEFEVFWQNRNSYDMIIGHRDKREDGIARIIVTKVLKIVLFVVFGIKIIDANTPYRLMKADSLAECLKVVPEKHFLTNVLLSVVYQKTKKVMYKPISFRCRQGGTNSINIRKIIKIGLTSITDFYRFKNKVK